ncbi:MAG: hypothetical protein IJ849_09445 [Selenomonadaceae bacterium]|nr:hypothetical protein [Selenomonadaceae bacterium]
MGAGRGRTGGAGGGGGKGGGGPVNLSAMSDSQLASFNDNALQANLPNDQYDSYTQRLINAAGWNDKPDVLPDAQVRSLARKKGAMVVYRTLKDDAKTSKSAAQIAGDFQQGNANNIGGWGGQAYGGGHYFASTLNESKSYGNRGSYTMAGVLNSKAKVVNMSDLRGVKGETWLDAHPNAAKSLGFTKKIGGGWTPASRGKRTIPGTNGKQSNLGDNAYTSLAMAMGYNVVQNNLSKRLNYYTVMDRSVVSVSDKNYYPQSRGLR